MREKSRGTEKKNVMSRLSDALTSKLKWIGLRSKLCFYFNLTNDGLFGLWER